MQLETERLLLREFTEDDWPAFWARNRETQYAEQYPNGYATEAARRMLRFAFEEPGVHRVGAHIVASNKRSLAVVQRLGFVPEGRLREHEHIGQEWRDDLLYGLLASEWAAQAGRV